MKTIAVLLLATASSLSAASLSWNGGTSNAWTEASNWTPNQAPAASDDLIISTGSPVQDVNWNISSGGSVTIDGGDVTWSGRFNTVGNGSAGRLLITSGSLTVNYAGGSSHSFNIGNGNLGGQRLFQQQGGTVNALNSNDEIFIKSDGHYEISAGVLNAGSILNGFNGTAPSQGKFSIIGDASVINLTSGYIQSSLGILDLDISSISLINALGAVSLAGGLDVSFLATPSVGQTFDIMQYGSLSGTFDSFDTLVDSPLGADTVSLGIDYGVNGDTVQLSVLSVVPEPTSSALLLSGLLCGVCRRSRR